MMTHHRWIVIGFVVGAIYDRAFSGSGIVRGHRRCEGIGMSPIAPPGQEGWLCQKENTAKHRLSAQTGWLFKLEQSIRTTTPSAPCWCFATFFDVAATPPDQEGQ